MERPILFSGPMVRAILDGSKTQTRRIVKLDSRHDIEVSDAGVVRPAFYESGMHVGCPYGRVGDRLWVRETWATSSVYDKYSPGAIPVNGILWWLADGTPATHAGKVRPSIFMPRWASRITLEITEVRVQRLQEISEEDAIAEGVPVGQRGTVPGDKGRSCVTCGKPQSSHIGRVRCCPQGHGTAYNASTYRGGFAFLWDSINGNKPGCSWSDNPYVWAITFKRVQP